MTDQGFDSVGGAVVVERRTETSVVLWGELDESVRDQTDAALDQVLGRALPVVVDASRVTFMGSAAVAFLSRLCEVGHEEGHSVTLHAPSRPVVEVLEILGLLDMFDRTVAGVSSERP